MDAQPLIVTHFLIRRPKANVAHIWTGADTFCRMASTGGLNKKRYIVHDTTLGLPLCSLCSNVAKSCQKA